MKRQGLLAFVDRLTCADLPSGLTSHACLPVSEPGARSVSTSSSACRASIRQHRKVRC